jgi:hypothetical protein
MARNPAAEPRILSVPKDARTHRVIKSYNDILDPCRFACNKPTAENHLHRIQSVGRSVMIGETWYNPCDSLAVLG